MSKPKALIPPRKHGTDKTGSVWEPWLTRKAITLLEKLLKPKHNGNLRGLEWGAGTGTKWFCERLSHLYTVEHNVDWAQRVKRHMQEFPELYSKWEISLVSTEDMGALAYRANSGLYFKKYATLLDLFFDVTGKRLLPKVHFVCVDGRARNACLKTAVRILEPDGGVLVLDNSERKRYNTVVVPAHWEKQVLTNGVWSTTIWRSTKKHG